MDEHDDATCCSVYRPCEQRKAWNRYLLARTPGAAAMRRVAPEGKTLRDLFPVSGRVYGEPEGTPETKNP